MNYSLEQEKKRNHNAGFKAVDDVTRILHEINYVPLLYTAKNSNRICRNVMTLYRILRLFFVINKDDVCFLQWPLLSNSKIILYLVLRYRCRHLQLLIHDLTSLRYDEINWVEGRFLEMSELIIAHTPAMKDVLVSKGIDKSKVVVLTCFDYLIKDQTHANKALSNNVVFAGNLEKSLFLKSIPLYPDLHKVSFLCYGKEVEGLRFPLLYKGLFEPECVSNIQGSWGLVWDGNSVETCKGELGEYLKINAPHKFSLYIVAGLPLIVWEQSALAYYVKEKGIGITIGSLIELPQKLSKIGEKQYEQILFNLEKERKILISGGHLKSLLSNNNSVG